jgi:hypothetical protein
MRRLVTLVPPSPEQGSAVAIESYDLYQGSGLVFRSRFESAGRVGGYGFPKRVVIENPDRRIMVTIQYEDVDVNVPVEDDAFILSGEGGR